MTGFLSKKTKLVSLFTTFAIVLIHAYNYTDHLLQSTTRISEGLNIGAMIEFGISNGITRFANPMFFMISGFLLFIKLDDSFKSYETALKKRCKSIVLPFAIWCGFWTVIMLILHYAGCTLPIVTEKYDAFAANKWALINGPFAFQLWYLVDLMKLCLLAPMFYFFNKTWKGYPIIVLFILWIFDCTYVINSDGLLFFSIGSFFAVNEDFKNLISKKSDKQYLGVVLGLATLVLVGLYTYFAACYEIFEVPDAVRIGLYKAFQITGVISVWMLFDNVNEEKNGFMVKYVAPTSFFVYTLHEPLQHIIFQSALKNTGSDSLHLVVFFGVAIGLAVILVLFGNVLIKVWPKGAGILTGGRSNGVRIENKA